MVSEAPFLPCHIRLFTKRDTNASLNLGSGAIGNFLALAFLMDDQFV
jgi:hypothetical protein